VIVSRDVEVGQCDLTIAQLVDRTNFDITHNGAPAGNIVFRQFTKVERPTFTSILRSGWQMSMVVAIDYTASNKDQRLPNSLHAMNANNQYEAAIGSCGSILEPYDHDKNFPVFGFGGVINNNTMSNFSGG
jgi:hypothetical protein